MGYEDVTVVLPTLNEEENIGRIIRILQSSYEGIRVMVSDDGSKDKTRAIVMGISKRDRNVALLDRSKERVKGLTASAVDGIKRSKTKYVVVMDADLQHPPEKIRDIVARLRKKYLVVVATRKSVKDWEMYRKVVSKFLITIGYAVLVARGKETCSDIFSGYFGVDRKFFVDIERKNRGSFVGEGYKILFDLLKCIDKDSVDVAEVGYVFNSREAGESKAGTKQVIALLKSFSS